MVTYEVIAGIRQASISLASFWSTYETACGRPETEPYCRHQPRPTPHGIARRELKVRYDGIDYFSHLLFNCEAACDPSLQLECQECLRTGDQFSRQCPYHPSLQMQESSPSHCVLTSPSTSTALTCSLLSSVFTASLSKDTLLPLAES